MKEKQLLPPCLLWQVCAASIDIDGSSNLFHVRSQSRKEGRLSGADASDDGDETSLPNILIAISSFVLLISNIFSEL